MYKFVKIKTQYPNGESYISDWCFYPETLSDVYDFFEKFTIPALKCGMEEEFWRDFKNHYLSPDSNPEHDLNTFEEYLRTNGSQFSFSAWLCARNAGIPLFYTGQRMALTLLQDRVKYFKDGLNIYHASDGLRNISPDKRYTTICDTLLKEELMFPELDHPSIEDVRLMMWDGGQHWYAKVHKFDVVVDGVQKWNTREEALNAARKFIEENWN